MEKLNNVEKTENVVDIKTQAADRLAEINNLRKQLEKEEKELKNMFKSSLKPGESFETDFAYISISEKSRESLNRKDLEVEFGADVISGFVKKTEYLQVDVKKK